MTGETVRAHVWVRGRVQGVWFRDSCATEAAICGVAGWVRNLRDGQVEAVFEGHAAAVERVVTWCRQGPPRAIVTDIEQRPESPEGLRGFTVR